MSLKCVREQADMTQLDLSVLLGVDRTTVTKWESGKSSPRFEMLPRIAAVLGCTIEELYIQKENPAEAGDSEVVAKKAQENREAIRTGKKTPNQVRKELGLSPQNGGDKRFIKAN